MRSTGSRPFSGFGGARNAAGIGRLCARAKNTKRGGADWQRVTLSEDGAVEETKLVDILTIEEAIGKLAAMDQRKARIVDLFLFGGLTADEAAETIVFEEPIDAIEHLVVFADCEEHARVALPFAVGR